MIWTAAAVSASNKQLDHADYIRIVQCQYSIPPPNGPDITATASLPRQYVKIHRRRVSEWNVIIMGKDGPIG